MLREHLIWLVWLTLLATACTASSDDNKSSSNLTISISTDNNAPTASASTVSEKSAPTTTNEDSLFSRANNYDYASPPAAAPAAVRQYSQDYTNLDARDGQPLRARQLYAVQSRTTTTTTSTEPPRPPPDPADFPPDNFICPDSLGFYNDPRKCSNYIVCTFNKPIVQHCNEALHFNDQLKICDWPNPVSGCIQRSKNEAYRPKQMSPQSPRAQTYAAPYSNYKRQEPKKGEAGYTLVTSNYAESPNNNNNAKNANLDGSNLAISFERRRANTENLPPVKADETLNSDFFNSLGRRQQQNQQNEASIYQNQSPFTPPVSSQTGPYRGGLTQNAAPPPPEIPVRKPPPSYNEQADYSQPPPPQQQAPPQQSYQDYNDYSEKTTTQPPQQQQTNYDDGKYRGEEDESRYSKPKSEYNSPTTRLNIDPGYNNQQQQQNQWTQPLNTPKPVKAPTYGPPFGVGVPPETPAPEQQYSRNPQYRPVQQKITITESIPEERAAPKVTYQREQQQQSPSDDEQARPPPPPPRRKQRPPPPPPPPQDDAEQQQQNVDENGDPRPPPRPQRRPQRPPPPPDYLRNTAHGDINGRGLAQQPPADQDYQYYENFRRQQQAQRRQQKQQPGAAADSEQASVSRPPSRSTTIDISTNDLADSPFQNYNAPSDPLVFATTPDPASNRRRQQQADASQQEAANADDSESPQRKRRPPPPPPGGMMLDNDDSSGRRRSITPPPAFQAPQDDNRSSSADTQFGPPAQFDIQPPLRRQRRPPPRRTSSGAGGESGGNLGGSFTTLNSNMMINPFRRRDKPIVIDPSSSDGVVTIDLGDVVDNNEHDENRNQRRAIKESSQLQAFYTGV